MVREVDAMDVEKESNNNLDRLLKHLKADSLAAQLVRIRRDSEAAKAVEGMKEILQRRLSTVAKEAGDGKT
jgi:hypothetical protein